MEEYVVYESFLVPIKGQLPDVKYIYLAGSLHQPEYTDSSNGALIFCEVEQAKETAALLGMQVGRLVTKVEKVY